MVESTIRVLVATYNASSNLRGLISSLANQTSSNFSVLFIDGASEDNTLELIRSIDTFDFDYITEKDFGIYHALNKGLERTEASYYLVMGADDRLSPWAIKSYSSYLHRDVDIVTARVVYKNRVLRPRRRRFSFFDDAWSHVSCHSVGCVFRTSLHQKYGFYSKRFPIAADQYFINKTVKGGAKIVEADFVAGEFGAAGVSSSDLVGHISETFRVQYETAGNRSLQISLYLSRLIKNRLIQKI